MSVRSERVVRIGCFVFKEDMRTPREVQVALLLENSVGDITHLPNIIERDARSIADAMASLHGGEWSVQIDHEAGYVLVRLS